jgi:hypothetical protein
MHSLGQFDVVCLRGFVPVGDLWGALELAAVAVRSEGRSLVAI